MFFLLTSLLVLLSSLTYFYIYFDPNRSSKSQKEVQNTCFYIGKTFHSRFFPVSHHFTYPIFFILFTLYNKEGKRDNWPWFMSWNKWNILSIHTKDFLFRYYQLTNSNEKEAENDSIEKRIEKEIKTRLKPTEQLLRVDAICMPRYFGYAFNPVIIYLLSIQTKSKVKQYLLLQVQNTFGESHFYWCLEDNEVQSDRKQFQRKFIVERQFHVSPFNDSQLGEYHIYFSLEPRLDLLILTWEAGKKKMVGRVTCEKQDLNLKWVWQYPIVLLLTFPRILYEAFHLVYLKGMKVYPRPEPKMKQDTLKRIYQPTSFDQYLEKLFLEYLNQGVHSLQVTNPLNQILTFDSKEKKTLEIKYFNEEFYQWPFLTTKPSLLLLTLKNEEKWTGDDFWVSFLLDSSKSKPVPLLFKLLNYYRCFLDYFLFGISPASVTLWHPLDEQMSQKSFWKQVKYCSDIVTTGMNLLLTSLLFHLLTPWIKGREPEPWQQIERFLNKK